MINEELVAFTRDRAAACAGISLRQVGYWARTGVVSPTSEARLSPRRPIVLYGYVDLMSLLVASRLRRRGVSLQNIRKIVQHLRDRGFARPLSELRFATLGKDVYIQLPDGTWESGLRPSQVVIHQVIELEPLRASIREMASRDPSTFGRIERRRGTLGGKAVVAGTRVPVTTIQRYLEQGVPTAEVLEAYPALTEADVEAARTYAVA